MTPRRWVEYLISVLVGNAIYFAVLLPGLPRSLQHQPFSVDAGLLLAFLCCVLVYGAIRLGSRHGKRMAADEEREDAARDEDAARRRRLHGERRAPPIH